MKPAFCDVEYCDGVYSQNSPVLEELYHKALGLVKQISEKFGLSAVEPQLIAALDVLKAVAYGAIQLVKYIRDACTTVLEYLGIM